MRSFPIRRIAFTTPTKERARLARVGTTEVTEWIEGTESVKSAAFSAFSGSGIGRWVEARLAATPEQADAIHDLLAHLAEQMIEMNKQKQAAVKAFWDDVEGVTDAATFSALREKGKQEATLYQKAEACRPFLHPDSHATRTLEESLAWNEDAFKAFAKALAAKIKNLSDLVGVYQRRGPAYRDLVTRLAATDRLIDRIVYRLYGLTEEEIAVVEGRARSS